MNPNYSFNVLKKLISTEYKDEIPEIVKKSLRIAFDFHAGQTRSSLNGEDIPYIIHPVETAILVIRNYTDIKKYIKDSLETLIAATLLHDVLEDTRCTAELIQNVIGLRVKNIVELLTKPSAGISGITKDERNIIFFQQIIDGGPSPVYIKICDSINNLGNPKNTPLNILQKAIKKAKEQYAKMLDRVELGDIFKKYYLELIKKLEDELVDYKYNGQIAQRTNTLQEAIHLCVDLSKKKIIELHDLPEILNNLLNIEGTTIWRCSGDKKNILTKIKLSHETDYTFKMDNLYHIPTAFYQKDLIKLPDSVRKDYSAMYSVPMQIDNERYFIVLTGITDVNNFEWINLDVIIVFVNFLTHRLIVAEIDKLMASDTVDYDMLIKQDENDALEYKSYFQWDVKTEKLNKELRFASLKTIVAFMNSSGGILVIGIDDDKNVLGLDNDIQFVKGRNLDGYERLLVSLICQHIGEEFIDNINIRFHTVEKKQVCLVEVHKSKKPVFLNKPNSSDFYIRIGNASMSLSIDKALAYIKNHGLVY